METVEELAPAPVASRKAIGGVVVTAITFLLGGALAIQAQLNGALTARTGSALLVTLLSFAIGTAVLALIVGLRRQWPSRAELRSWSWHRWWLFSGPLGAFLIVAISAGVPLLGVALTTVLTVAGQTVTGIVLDSRGTGVGARLRISGTRAAAVLVAIVGLAITVLAVPIDSSTSIVALIAMILVLIAAGVASALQQAANGAVAGISGSPAFAALVSFSTGLIVLIVASLAMWATGNLPASAWPSFSGEPLLFLGGLFGTLFVVSSAWAVRRIGVLVLSLAVVAGQIIAAVALDVSTGSANVGFVTILSIVAVLAAVVLAVVPSRRRKTERGGGER